MITHFYEKKSGHAKCHEKQPHSYKNKLHANNEKPFREARTRASKYFHFRVRSHPKLLEKKCNISRAVHPHGVSAWVQDCQGRGKLTATGAARTHIIYPAEVAVHVWPTGKAREGAIKSRKICHFDSPFKRQKGWLQSQKGFLWCRLFIFIIYEGQ